MRLQWHVVFWLAALAGFILFLMVFRTILLPFVAGAALAYALDPVAGWFERHGFNRLAATLTILVVFVVSLAALLILLGPIVINQLISLIEQLPTYATQLHGLFVSLLDSEWARFLGIDSDTVGTSLTNFMTQGRDIMSTVVASIWTGGRVIIDVVSLLVITPIVAAYLLYDWERIIARVDELVPREHVEEVRRLARAMDAKTAAFVRGQVMVSSLLALFYVVSLIAVGLEYGLLIGLISGFLSFVPFLGFTVGFILSTAVSAVQFWPAWIWIAVTVGIYLIGQMLEGYILQPRLVGRNVGLHPVWLFFALFAFGYLFGFVGLLVAVPASAAVGVLLRFAIDRYEASELYRGPDDPPKQS
jgi:predicted PurR-regulated permease PerM